MALENLIGRLQILQEVVGAEETAERVSIAAASTVIPEYKTRIFTDGLTTSGSPIGQYSTNPFYQNPNALIGVAASGITPAGKTGQTVFKNGKRHKTKYLSGGYSELRQLTGRQNSTVDLNFSGSLERSVRVVVESSVAYIRYTNEAEAEKMAGNETRFGADISTVSNEERELGERAAAIELREILDEIL
jgi:hypothetical protein